MAWKRKHWLALGVIVPVGLWLIWAWAPREPRPVVKPLDPWVKVLRTALVRPNDKVVFLDNVWTSRLRILLRDRLGLKQVAPPRDAAGLQFVSSGYVLLPPTPLNTLVVEVQNAPDTFKDLELELLAANGQKVKGALGFCHGTDGPSTIFTIKFPADIPLEESYGVRLVPGPALAATIFGTNMVREFPGLNFR